MQVVVGLGNPGDKYHNTRHNIGWLALDYFLGEVAWSTNKRFNAQTYYSGTVLYIKPLSFMNESGQAVRLAMDYYNLIPRSLGLIRKRDADLTKTLLVIHDELDLGFGSWKISTDSRSAGHRGVQSLIDHLKTQKISRLRLGIKNDLLRHRIPAEKFVLQNFSQEELAALPGTLSQIDLKAWL